MELITLEQLEVLMLVASAEHPLATALEVRRRWLYIREVALAARAGGSVDPGLPQVVRECELFIARAEGIIAVLNEWISDLSRRPSPDAA